MEEEYGPIQTHTAISPTKLIVRQLAEKSWSISYFYVIQMQPHYTDLNINVILTLKLHQCIIVPYTYLRAGLCFLYSLIELLHDTF